MLEFACRSYSASTNASSGRTRSKILFAVRSGRYFSFEMAKVCTVLLDLGQVLGKSESPSPGFIKAVCYCTEVQLVERKILFVTAVINSGLDLERLANVFHMKRRLAVRKEVYLKIKIRTGIHIGLEPAIDKRV